MPSESQLRSQTWPNIRGEFPMDEICHRIVEASQVEISQFAAQDLLGQARFGTLFGTPLTGQRPTRTRSFTARRLQSKREQFMKIEDTGFAKWSKKIELETVC